MQRYYLPINVWFWRYYAIIVVRWEAKFPSDSKGTLFFPKQHYESIVPEKSGIDRISASHDTDLLSLIAMRRQHLQSHIAIDVTTRRGT